MTRKTIQVEPEESIPPEGKSPCHPSKPLTVGGTLGNLLGMIIRKLILSLLFASSGGILFSAEKNIIFFITDDESPTLGCYGDKVAKTPAIDALAEDGTLFLNAYATTASCSASRSVVMSAVVMKEASEEAMARLQAIAA